MKHLGTILVLLAIKNTYGQKILIADSINAIGLYTEIKTSNESTYYSVQFGNSSIYFQYNIKGVYYMATATNAIETFRVNVGQHKERNGLLEYVLSSHPNLPKIVDTIRFYFNRVIDSTKSYLAFYVNHLNDKWKYLGSIVTSDTAKPKFVQFNKRKKDRELQFQNTWLEATTRNSWIAIDTTLSKTPPNSADIPKLKQK